MLNIFGRDGALKNFLENFEYRHEQLEMAEFILEGLYERKNILIEAGTGIGKTLSYLIPSIIYCLENKKKLALTTETKALQQQLINKDLPLVKNILKKNLFKDFKYSLCLGSSNYPCRKRFELMTGGGRLSKNDIENAGYINGLFKSDRIFSRLDLKISGKLWSEFSREPDICGYHKCPFSQACVYQRARKEWINSDVLVMNHYLFFSNIASGKAYLPKFDVVIFDEAHSVEEIASDQLGFDISYEAVMELLRKMQGGRKKKNLLSRISDSSKREKSVRALEKLSEEISSFFEKARSRFTGNQYTFRFREPPGFGESLVKSLKDFLSGLEGTEEFFDDEASLLEFDVIRSRLFQLQLNIESLVYLHNENFVYWMERRETDLLGDIKLTGRPVNVSEIMQREVNTFYDSSIFVSATLAAGGDFSYITNRLGIENSVSLLLSSPFNFKNQVILYLGSETESPDAPGYISTALDISREIISSTGGNCLFLFTSYSMLERIKEELAGMISFKIYSQGDYPATETVERYINDDGSILMGTHSFWQGIDLPGDLLKAVILMRLPFSVPDRPLVQARIELLQQAALNPFFNYQIPCAIIRFKQGFGRLIRSNKDRGIVAVLDPRITTKGYGKLFLDSLPECKTVTDLAELKKQYHKIIEESAL